MALAERADLVARLSLKDDFSRPLSGVQRKIKGFSSSIGRISKGIAVGATAAVGVASVVITRQVQSGLNSLAELEDATTSVDGAIKQMGLTGQITSGQIATWANEIEASVQAAFDDKAITQAATTLLRYGKLTPKNLKPALVVMTDLAAKTGSVESASALLAKALADPANAAGKLARVGVVLTDQQEKQIATFIKNGKTAKAQAFLLDALEQSTKGAAEAMHGPFRDSQLIFADVMEDAQRALAIGFIPVLQEVRRELADALAKPETIQRIKEFGQGLADGFREVVKFVKQIPWDQVGSTIGGLVDFGKGLASAFMGLPTEAKQLMLGLAALNKLSGGAVINVGFDLAKGAVGGLFAQFLGRGSAVNPMFVVPVGGALGGGVPVPGGGKASFIGGAGRLLGTVAIAATSIVAISELLKIRGEQSEANRAQGEALVQQTTTFTKNATTTEMLSSLRGIEDYQAKLANELTPESIAYAMNIDGVADRIKETKAELLKGIAASERTTTAVETMRGNMASATRAAADRSVNAAERTKSAIVSAIRGIQRPIVTVNVSQSTTRVTYTTGTTLSRYYGKTVPI